ncbi:hypothetical protein NM688_g8140 [Phlebia brevispora]|uniref:Uncharacterized protein n=1 Tax=Phlebia brevispora TaxID=194682 RepID=A0ACC1RWU2_9APHY|nr:hypothetical protein NM688_g8140 [Phlebia brevispora]
MLVELKNGETFNGHLVNCDNFMNITLREVYQTNAEGDRFWKLKECYIRGSTIKYIRVPDTLLDAVKEEQNRAREAGRRDRGGHTGGPGRGGKSAVAVIAVEAPCAADLYEEQEVEEGVFKSYHGLSLYFVVHRIIL